MSSDRQRTRTYQVPMTKRWVVFAAALFLLQATVLSVLHVQFPSLGLAEGWLLAANTIIIWVISVLLGQFCEYAFRRIEFENAEA